MIYILLNQQNGLDKFNEVLDIRMTAEILNCVGIGLVVSYFIIYCAIQMNVGNTIASLFVFGILVHSFYRFSDACTSLTIVLSTT